MAGESRWLTRRSYLAGVGATATLAGCASDGSSDDRPEIKPPDSDEPLAGRYDQVERETVYHEVDGESLRVVASLPDAAGPVPVIMHYHGGAYRGGGRAIAGWVC